MIVASSKYKETKTLHSLLENASTNRENLLKEVTVKGEAEE